MKRSPMRRRAKPNSYNTRERAPEAWWHFVKGLPCVVRQLAEIEASDTNRENDLIIVMTNCEGEIEADHMGERGLSHKAPDSTCVPMCTKHHRERTDFSGAFKFFTRPVMRAFVSTAIQLTQNRARYLGVEVPTC